MVFSSNMMQELSFSQNIKFDKNSGVSDEIMYICKILNVDPHQLYPK